MRRGRRPTAAERAGDEAVRVIRDHPQLALYVSEHILSGLAMTLQERQGWTAERAQAESAKVLAMARLSGGGYVPAPRANSSLALSEDDRRVHDLALEVGAAFLVSSDQDFRRAAGGGSGPRILSGGLIWCTPRDFTALISEHASYPGSKTRRQRRPELGWDSADDVPAPRRRWTVRSRQAPGRPPDPPGPRESGRSAAP